MSPRPPSRLDRTIKNDRGLPRTVTPRETSEEATPTPQEADPAAGPADAEEAKGSGGTVARTAEELLEFAPRARRNEVNALETRILVNELQVLVGGYLDKAYQPTRDEVLLRFRAPEVGRRDLFFRRGRWFCFTETPPENPIHPPGFAMALRKHVCGGKVFKVEQMGYDRVVTIWVQRKEGTFRIVLELLGDGNCILVRPDGRIFVPLVQEAWASRTIRSGQPYVPPPARDDPLTLDEEAFVARAASGERDLVRALAVGVGLGGAVAEEVAARAGLEKKKAASEATTEEWQRAYASFRGLIEEAVEGRAQAQLLREDGRAVDFSGFPSKVLHDEVEASGGTKELVPMPSLSAAIDTLYLSGRGAEAVSIQVSAVDSRLTKLERQKKAQEEALIKFDREIGEKSLQGEALFAHYQSVERIREQLLAARRNLDWKEIQARIEAGKKSGNPDAEMVVRIDPHKGVVVLRLTDPEGTPHDIPIDISKTVTENAQAAYERSKTARDKLAGAKVALSSTLEKMQSADADKASAEAAVEEAMQREKHLVPANRHWWFEAFRWFWTTSGELVAAGRDAGTNDRLVKKHLEEDDRYVHADMHGAPSVVVKAPAKDVPPSAEGLEQAAQAAVTYSRAFGSAGSGDAYWVTPPQVSKTPQAGEYLARGAFIVRGERNWFRKMPLEASIGLVWLDAEGRPTEPPADELNPGARRAKIMGGPPAAVHAHTDRWIDVVAGNEKRSDAVKRLATALGAHPDAVDRALPPGDIKIVGVKGLHLEERE